jgi:hypothetical protein
VFLAAAMSLESSIKKLTRAESRPTDHRKYLTARSLVEAAGVEPDKATEIRWLADRGNSRIGTNYISSNLLHDHCTASSQSSHNTHFHLRTPLFNESILKFVSSIPQLLLGGSSERGALECEDFNLAVNGIFRS